jgi:hypothetical protein
MGLDVDPGPMLLTETRQDYFFKSDASSLIQKLPSPVV